MWFEYIVICKHSYYIQFYTHIYYKGFYLLCTCTFFFIHISNGITAYLFYIVVPCIVNLNVRDVQLKKNNTPFM